MTSQKRRKNKLCSEKGLFSISNGTLRDGFSLQFVTFFVAQCNSFKNPESSKAKKLTENRLKFNLERTSKLENRFFFKPIIYGPEK